MKRTEYIDAARQTLAKYDAEYAEDFIRSLEEHFDEGVSEGKSEEELCEELGPIEDVLDELEQAIGEALKNRADVERTNENKIVESEKAVGTEKAKTDDTEKDVGLGNADRVEIPTWTGDVRIEQSTEDQKYDIQVVSGVRDETAQITKITADLGFADVRIEKTSDSVPSIHLADDCAESADWWLDERVEGSTYVVKLCTANSVGQSSKKTLLDRFINIVVTPALSYVLLVPESIEIVNFMGTSGDVEIDGLKVGKLDLHISSGDVDAKNVFAKEISISSTSGDIDAANMFATESLKLNSTSGDVDVESVSGEHVSAKSTSGDVDIEESSAETLEVSSTSGDAEIEECKAIKLAMSTISGDIRIYDSASQSAVLSSTSGDVEAKNTTMSEMKTNTVSGDLYLNICGDMDGTINAMSGDVKIRVNNENRGLKVTFSSMSGVANINYGGECRRIEKNGTFATGDESTKLNIRTMSGSANIS